MPKVANKLEVYFSTLPIPRIDNKKHCVCTYCKECLCDFCNKWTKINTYSIKETTNWDHKYILLFWFQAGMVLKHIQEVGDMYREVCLQFRHSSTKYTRITYYCKRNQLSLALSDSLFYLFSDATL